MIKEIASEEINALSTEVLKEHYLDCLDPLSAKVPSLCSIVRILLSRKVDWRDLIRWATQGGYKDRYVRKVLCQILTDLGIRRRKPGAGRETPQKALVLLTYARARYGCDAVKLLGAAHRAGRAEDDENAASFQIHRIEHNS